MSAAGGGGGVERGDADEARAGSEEEALLSKVQKLMARIMERQFDPNPRLIHSLATMFEAQEARYIQESANSSFNNGRANHCIGKLGNLIRENDEFYELVFSKFLSESGYSPSVCAASARLLISCSTSWVYPHVFEDAVLDSIKAWVMEDNLVSGSECNWKYLGRQKPTDSEMLRTYSIGLLAIALAGGGQVVEDTLTSGLSAKLMHYLRVRVLGEAISNQKDGNLPSDREQASVAMSSRVRDDNRGKSRQVLDSLRLDGIRIGDGFVSADGNFDKGIGVKQSHGEQWRDGSDLLKSELADTSSEIAGAYEMSEENADLTDDRWHSLNIQDGKLKYADIHVAGRLLLDEDSDEGLRDDSSRRRLNRAWQKIRGKGKIGEGILESESNLSPGTRGSKDRNFTKNEDTKKIINTKKESGYVDSNSTFLSGDADDRLKDCFIGQKDISEFVMRAIRAAESEAKAANAPTEAIKAAGDAAAELVKTAALEVWRSKHDVDAAVLAANKAASTVVEAAMSTDISRSSQANEEVMDSKSIKHNEDEEFEDFVILDDGPLSQLREKYCMQCLEILGEYVEALGPVLHEKGLDVCLALLQRSVKDQEASDRLGLSSEVLKLICALAAHKKFAALFVDRGGIQRLLSVRRGSQTFVGLSSCLFTIGSLQGVMERVCALPSDVVHRVVELALQLLECPQDQARKNAAIFFAAAFVFRAILDSFDAQEGLQKVLSLLHGAASVRSGSNSGLLGTSNVNLRNDGSPAEVLTALEKQVAYHSCVALRQYFRAHLLLHVDCLRPNKNARSAARSTSIARAAYKPLDISNEAMDAVFLQIQRDRKLGPALVRVRWTVVDKFLASNGHLTMLELCQAPPVERYLHDLAQYAFGVLHIVTFVPYSRKLIVNATLSNNRVAMAVILDAANGAGYVDPEVIHPALNVLVNLVCPPPSISNKPSASAHGQQSVSVQALSGPSAENRDRSTERSASDRILPLSTQSESRERNGEGSLVERISAAGVIGDRRISLGPGTGCAGLVAQMEQGYHQARESVRANNGIKVLLHLLHPRMITPPGALDCIRALACRVLLGLAKDDSIAHILTKLQVGKKLSELIRDSSGQSSGAQQGRWQTELTQVAIELIAILTNSGRATTLAATDAAAPTLRRIERAAIAAATPISYHSRELLQLIHEHLQACGLATSAATLQKEADLTPLPSLGGATLLHQASVQEPSPVQLHWPSGRVGFLQDTIKMTQPDEEANLKFDLALSSSKKKPLIFSSSLSQTKTQPKLCSTSTDNATSTLGGLDCSSVSILNSNADGELLHKTPILLPMKRKFLELKDGNSASPAKRAVTVELVSQYPVCQTPVPGRRCPSVDVTGQSPTAVHTSVRTNFSNIPVENLDDIQYTPRGPTPVTQAGLTADQQLANVERMTLDSLVVQYLKHQHRQCPAPITTLPSLSLLHPHVCPEPSRSLSAPANVTARAYTREISRSFSGIKASRRDRQFIYSRFKPCRVCRDDVTLLTSIAFLGDSSRIATGNHSGELKIFDTNSGNLLENQSCHQTHMTLLQSASSGGSQLILTSSVHEVRLWDAFSISNGPLHSFEGCKAAQFGRTGTVFAALSTDSSHREVLLYDVQTCNVELRLPDSSNAQGRGHSQSLIHFGPYDALLLWNGVLWDRRTSNANAIHQFDQFTDYGGGGFHPSGNEVIINSEVWDLRKFRLLRSVPSLDQTVITFNNAGDVIYAILRRNLEDITSAVNTRRVRHPLFPAFRTIDAVNYSEIATVQVDRCVLDFATDPTDTLVGVVAMDDHEEMFSSARLFEIGRKKPTNDDSDPEDGGETEDEDEDNDESEGDDMLAADLEVDGDSDSEDLSNDEDDEDVDIGDENDDDGDFNIDDVDFGVGHGLLEIMAEGNDDEGDDSEVVESLSSGEEGDYF